MSSKSFSIGYSSFIKTAGADMIGGFGSLMTSLNVNTDLRNRELDDKLDAIISMLQPEDGTDEHGKVTIVGADNNAKNAIKDKKKLIAQALLELKESGRV